ncbi:MAG TPA: phytoene desaturase family protein [Candidatus Edwardsbacteria bacterium]|nr:phytoene desaturase family protein [Candidatus Edwardsbacteria bacterium]
MPKKIIIIGAGPGGLTAGMLLAHRGYQVEILEKDGQVGGRNGPIKLGGYTFDTGPTFLMLLETLEQTFRDAGRDMNALLDLRRLEPMYRLRFHGSGDFFPVSDEKQMVKEVERAFPGDGQNYLRFRDREGKKFDKVYPCLKVPYDSLLSYLKPRFLKAIPRLDPFASVYDRLASYFTHDDLRIAMTFQAKYLGMSPWQCPATFTILSVIEHKYGIYHPIGGLHTISRAMAKCTAEDGGNIRLNTPVKQLIVKDRAATGVLLENGETVAADAVIINPDFAWAMSNIVKPEDRRKYTDAKLGKMEYSCSTFMLYLGVDKKYDIPHHNVIFARSYRDNVDEIVRTKTLPKDPSIYIQNACVTDPSLAPPGKSTLYVLVPIANQTSGIDWAREKTAFRDLVIRTIVEKTELKDLERHIEVEKVITPADWQRGYNIYHGATFNLSHKISQMLSFRPHNRFEEFRNCYLVGGGTHPGSGLPTIYQSGRIAAGMISGHGVS